MLAGVTVGGLSMRNLRFAWTLAVVAALRARLVAAQDAAHLDSIIQQTASTQQARSSVVDGSNSEGSSRRLAASPDTIIRAQQAGALRGPPSGLTPAGEETAHNATEATAAAAAAAAAAVDAAAATKTGQDAAFPSPRCAGREEWRETCTSWSGKPHNRYLEVDKILPREGIGANLMRVAWALNRAMTFDLEPVFVGPFIAGHGVGDFGEWMGLVVAHPSQAAAANDNTTSGEIRDREGFRASRRQVIPFPEGNGDSPWFREQINRTSVVYVPEMMRVQKIADWGVPVSPPPSDPHVCPYVRQVLRTLFWSAPRERDRCASMLPQDGDFFPPPIVVEEQADAALSEAEGIDGLDQQQQQQHQQRNNGEEEARKRPWVVAVHVRRGDMVRFHGGVRSVPHAYFVEAVRAVLRAISAADSAARVSILVFSEGPAKIPERHLQDEKGRAVTWDIPHENCLHLGLRCAQKILLRTNAFDTFECLATADVVVGSESSMSEAAAAVSTNVKVMLWQGQTEQDRVSLESSAVVSAGRVSTAAQLEMNAAVANWRFCSGEARRATGDDAASAMARNFYETVEGTKNP